MNKYIMEFIGTFFLVLAICMTVIGGLGNLAPIAIGSTLMVMIYAGGHISGAHYNPAVTLAVLMRGKCDLRDVPGYMIAQVLAAIAAAFIAQFLLASMSIAPPTPMNISTEPTIIAEVLGTFALAFVILNVATSKDTDGNSYFGLAIGFTVTSCAYMFGGISGGVFNPAVAIGTCIVGMSPWSALWVFLLATFAGGALAAVVFKAVKNEADD